MTLLDVTARRNCCSIMSQVSILEFLYIVFFILVAVDSFHCVLL